MKLIGGRIRWNRVLLIATALTFTWVPACGTDAEPEGGDAAWCPDPGSHAGACPEPAARWARDPASGACCRYASRCAAPTGWATFASERECDPVGCSCDSVRPSSPSTAGTAYLPLECRTVPESPPDATTACGPGQPDTVRYEGCGKIWFTTSGGFSGSTITFDAVTGMVTHVREASDVPYGPCFVHHYEFGERAEACDAAEACSVCGVSPELSPCD